MGVGSSDTDVNLQSTAEPKSGDTEGCMITSFLFKYVHDYCFQTPCASYNQVNALQFFEVLFSRWYNLRASDAGKHLLYCDVKLWFTLVCKFCHETCWPLPLAFTASSSGRLVADAMASPCRWFHVGRKYESWRYFFLLKSGVPYHRSWLSRRWQHRDAKWSMHNDRSRVEMVQDLIGRRPAWSQLTEWSPLKEGDQGSWRLSILVINKAKGKRLEAARAPVDAWRDKCHFN